MTITETGRRTREQLLAEAREKFAGAALPSKTQFAKTLQAHFNTASPVYDTLSEERAAVDAERRQARRRRMARLGHGKRFRSAPAVRPRPFTSPSQTPAPIVPEPVLEPVRTAVAEAVGKTFRVESETPSPAAPRRRPASWPIFLLTLPAFVAIWGGWVDMGRLTGFGVVHPFPGIPGLDDVAINMAITLPVSLETYAAYALYVWLSALVPADARRFAKWSAIGSLTLGASGQVAYHLMVAAGVTRAPWEITTIVACLPVAVLGMGATLRHLVHLDEEVSS
jgi:hypothetical protein